MAHANNITRLAELAVQAYLRSCELDGIDPESILAGMDDGRVVIPRILCNSPEAQPDGHPDDAVWQCRVDIDVINACDTSTENAHHEMAGAVFSQLMAGRTATADAISAIAAGFQCEDIFPIAQSKKVDDRKWVSTLSLNLKCIGTD